MSLTDAFGYPVTLLDRSALDAWTKTIQAFLAHGAATPDHLAKTLETAPDFPMAHVAKGIFYLLLGRSELIPVATEAHSTALTIAAGGGANARERRYVEALGAYLAGRLGRAAEIMDEILVDWPRDALAAKFSHQIRFVLGDSWGMRHSVEAVIEHYGEDHPMGGYIAGCHSFALEETGHYEAAETRGRAAIERCPDDAWALHSVAHVYDMTARDVVGIKWLQSQQHRWSHCNNFRYHVWWHLALFHLDRGSYDVVLDLYDTEIRRDKTDDYRDISNGASMLTRLEIEGVDVGERWEELADLSANRVEDGCVVFADLHYLLSLEGGKRTAEADALIERIVRDAQRSDHDMHEVQDLAGAPAAMGLACFRAGHYGGAYRHLVEAQKNMRLIGGSHAQRDVFTRLTVEAAMRAGLWDEAESVLARRVKKRGAADGYTHRRMDAINLRRVRQADEARPALRVEPPHG